VVITRTLLPEGDLIYRLCPKSTLQSAFTTDQTFPIYVRGRWG